MTRVYECRRQTRQTDRRKTYYSWPRSVWDHRAV